MVHFSKQSASINFPDRFRRRDEAGATSSLSAPTMTILAFLFISTLLF